MRIVTLTGRESTRISSGSSGASRSVVGTGALPVFHRTMRVTLVTLPLVASKGNASEVA